MKILQFTTYSLTELDHGGKIRSHYIKQGFSNFSEIETVSFSWEDSDSLSGFEVSLSSHRYAEQGGHYLLGDIAIDEYLQSSMALYNEVGNKIKCYAPTHILIEQPFLWPVVESLLNDGYLAKSTKIIYSSHNIEHVLKKKIYSDLLPEEKAESLTQRVRDIELSLTKRADLLLSVSKQEKEYLVEYNQSSPIVVVANGNNRATDESCVSSWKEKFAVEDGANWIFVGSWHPPNINGLLDLQQHLRTDSVTLNSKIWVLGSVANGLKADPVWDKGCKECFNLVGPVSIEDLDGAIQACDGIILPIWEGAGSNLKTSQALISGKQVIATSFAFRGFEEYEDEDGVLVVDSVEEFVSAMDKMHVSDHHYQRQKCIAALTWDGILSKFSSEELVIEFFRGSN
ncbi:hypothetical protein B9J90_07110 [Vibrio sp. V09_P4A23P171]|uniref:glycosyltransferase n=1 Tax=Vibrio sp. V09_P4A23P171 TaxID=1938664 RepID=UPI000B8EBA48|nr:glycosyltransferase [Vibrio sp. V09_P4A23P171]OXX36955.1 hypothetical protein B9J90_07110 [Vibrio sp. V09_P4A23P171]